MNEQGLRLGDLLDDYCLRCRRLLNHAVASMMNGQVVKVICQTCYTEHAYQHGEGGKKKANSRTTLFDQVLAKFSSSDVPPAPETPAARKKPPAEARSITRPKGKAPRGKK
ncbi:MAG: hypothetical protein ABSG54_13210 [Terriglobia bacterium]|jgi:hypothetical protein